MLTIWGQRSHRLCDGVSRRDFLKIGGLGLGGCGGLTLPNLLRLQAQGAVNPKEGPKAVIFIYMFGGPSHIDMYDLKPDAPVEIRGEFKPIQTNVPGVDICELMPLQAKIAHKMAIVRGVQTVNSHEPDSILTGYPPPRGGRPSIGAVVSRMRGWANGMPPYVSLAGGGAASDRPGPGYLGTAHRAFNAKEGTGLENLTLHKEMDLDRLSDRRSLLNSFDTLRRDLDSKGELDGLDSFNAKAFEMISSSKTRDAFDISKESAETKAKYGRDGTHFLQARRLVESGVSLVYLSDGPDWDDHDKIFPALRGKLPRHDHWVHALVTDLYERGLDKHVAVLICGEMGRSPKIGTETGRPTGRDHWAAASFAIFAGGGLRMGQALGDTGPRAERIPGNPFTIQNLHATLYHVLGIDPNTTFSDLTGRPLTLLDDPKPIEALI
jgi:hypothetical protein